MGSSGKWSVPWFRVITEGVVIVLSILLAFGIDAWWEERQLQRDLQDDLVDVAREIRSNISAVNVELHFQRTAVSSVDDLLGRIDAAGDAPWITLPDTVASFAMVFPPTVEASTGAVSALITGGSLSRLEDRELAAILGNIEATIEDVRETELGARRVAMEELVPLFWDSPGLASAIGRSEEFRLRGLEDVPLVNQAVRLPNLAGLENRLLLRRAWVAASAASLERLKAELLRAEELLAEGSGSPSGRVGLP